MERKAIEFRQLCALVRAIIQRDPRIDDAEWKARTLDEMAKLGFLEPTDPQMVTRAMTQVEFAVRKTLGPRPTPLVATPEETPKRAEIQHEGRTHQPAGWDLVQRLMATLQDSKGSAPTSAPPPRETLPLTEEAAVNEFWRLAAADGADRVALLRAFAEVAIIRSVTWNEKAIRAEAARHQLTADRCFGCRSDADLQWHHIIQIQHGGSNYVRNRVAICGMCHTDIHPWLSADTAATRRKLGGWSHISGLMDALVPGGKKETA